MTRPSNDKILAFMNDLVKVQREHDLWLEATEDNTLWVSNDEMGEEIEMFWEHPVKDGEPVEILVAKLEPERLSTEDENET